MFVFLIEQFGKMLVNTQGKLRTRARGGGDGQMTGAGWMAFFWTPLRQPVSSLMRFPRWYNKLDCDIRQITGVIEY